MQRCHVSWWNRFNKKLLKSLNRLWFQPYLSFVNIGIQKVQNDLSRLHRDSSIVHQPLLYVFTDYLMILLF